MSSKPPVVPTLEVRLPDLGTPGEVTVLELLVKVGDQVEKEQALLTLESEKATMDVPATAAGKVARILVKAGDKVSSGTAVLELEGPRQIVAEEVDAAPAAPQLPRTPRQAEPFGGLVQLFHPNGDRLAFRQHVCGAGNTLVTKVRDVQQTIDGGAYVHDRTRQGDFFDRAL